MRPLVFCLVIGASVSSMPLASCTADIHDNTVDINATITAMATADVTNVQPGSTVPVHVDVSNVVLVDPNTTPTPDEAPNACYLKYYIDSTSSAAVLVSAMTDVSVPVPASEPPGMHKVICQLVKHDGTPTSTQSDVEFTVSASASASSTTTTGSSDDGGTTSTTTTTATAEAGATIVETHD
jgi:hypothetical protein